ncbi:MAG: hypothetical protein HQL05_12305 [Nitrospirae bacterium]|uniref:hypothetical protein n=1 Tax=Candidatus Magnetobacterium casense TaxID=1455061 RepID=UPI0012DF4CB3|nr:hypothetical protein [Candidatus Magnetobacterium casensis]MBF0338598.1 hypothetical protein [Nitrospirota bacterium]
MALPIKDTPALKGKDADRFYKRAKEAERGLHRKSDEEIKRMLENADRLKEFAKLTDQ